MTKEIRTTNNKVAELARVWPRLPGVFQSLATSVTPRICRLCFFILSSFVITHSSSAADPTVDFSRQIRPLLAEKCFQCHGLDAELRETDLRLDTKEGLFAEVESGGVAVVPGDLGESVVYRRLVGDDEDERMPPADSKQLTAEEIELIKSWIESGATWQQHWSLVAPQRPGLPKISDPKWPRSEFDHFVLGRLDREGLKPSPEADKLTLLRRVTFDLTGLPPTLKEADDFLADESDQAYEKAIDRLLKSPHYGEHMGRYWLDAARYGDTHGLHLDNFRQIWPYRDWVIKAFNANMPFDQFTIEQLAGDLLPNATLDQRIATGFNRCNVTTSEGGVIPGEYFVHYTNDRVATTSTVWMGISMGCVTCHEHKFDPFEMKDFYQLFAFFNSLDGPVMDGNRQDTAPVLKVATAEQESELADLDKRIGELSKVMTSVIAEVDKAQREWEVQTLKGIGSKPEWRLLAAEAFTSKGGATLTKLEDASILVAGKNADDEVYEVVAQVPDARLTAIRLEGLLHESLTAGGAGRSSNSNVVLSEFEAEIASATEPAKWQSVKFARAWADHEQAGGDFKIANAIDGKKETGWAIAGHEKKEDRVAIFVADKPFGHEGGTRLRIRLRHESIHKQHHFGRFRLSVTSADNIPEIGAASAPAEIVKLLQIEQEKRNADLQNKIRDHYRQNVSTHEQLVQTRTELAASRKRKTDLDNSLATTLIWKELAEPKPAYILTRGAYDKQGEQVSRNTPAALPPLQPLPEGEIPTRLHLAKWLVSPEHPLAARVTVNRFWQQYFGTGIVETTEDFGSQGTPPSHPQLLDWLAVDFRESGWDVKRFHKMIVMSATYRQSSRVSPEMLKRDRANRLLARGPRFRNDAEVIRDSALAVGGLLVGKIGGPSVKPYQPPGIWYAVGYTDSNTAKFTRDNGDALYRRSMYTFWKRTAPPPTMSTLDAPSRENCTVRRSRTNTPLAALALMNDEQFVEASRAFAQRAMIEGGKTDEERATWAFRLALTRNPTDAELAVLMEVYRTTLAKYQADKEAATKLISIGESKPDENLDPSQLAAWTLVGNLILNLDETVTKG
ncbi:MAG: hypothetical protein CMJ64_13660 [Planctomycetaceae bacterium]|nr:hypothetical protein [Planctomycetaceae bacterium]